MGSQPTVVTKSYNPLQKFKHSAHVTNTQTSTRWDLKIPTQVSRRALPSGCQECHVLSIGRW